MSETTVPRLLTSSQAAECLTVSLATLKRLRRDGDLPAIKIGHCLRFHPADIAAFVESRRRQIVA